MAVSMTRRVYRGACMRWSLSAVLAFILEKNGRVSDVYHGV
jgi:hypothetical protein